MPKNRKFKRYGYNTWFTEKKLDDKEELDETPALEGDEKVKKGKRLKILTTNELLIRLPLLIAQTKIGTNSKKLKNEIRKILELLYQHNKITDKVYNNLIKLL